MRMITTVPSLPFFLDFPNVEYPVTFDATLNVTDGKYWVTDHFQSMDKKNEYVFKQSCDSEKCNPDESPF